MIGNVLVRDKCVGRVFGDFGCGGTNPAGKEMGFRAQSSSSSIGDMFVNTNYQGAPKCFRVILFSKLLLAYFHPAFCENKLNYFFG